MGVAQVQSDGVPDVLNQSLVFWELVTLAAVVAVLAPVVGRLVAGTPAATPARSILDERYARGEIGRDEYEQKRRDLRR